MTAALADSNQAHCSAVAVPFMSVHSAVTKCEIGLTSTHACSREGIVAAETETLLTNVRGKGMVRPMLMIALRDLAVRPTVVVAAEPLSRARSQRATLAGPEDEPWLASFPAVAVLTPTEVVHVQRVRQRPVPCNSGMRQVLAS